MKPLDILEAVGLTTGEEMQSYTDWVTQAQSYDMRERNDAFDHLARNFEGMVYAIAYRRLSDRQLAEDAAQEAFLTAYTCIAQLKDVRAFPAWLKRIALSKADRALRQQAPPITSFEAGADLPAAEPTPEASLEDSELRKRVRLAIAALPDLERDVTRDYYLLGESQREISERLNIPLATVKKRLQYAREHLRGLLTGFNETLDRAIYGEPLPPKQLQPVYISRRRWKR